MVESEDGDAGGDEENDKVFVERVAFAENGQMEEHDGEELAGFGEDVGDVVDMGEGGVAEGRGKGGGDGDEKEGEDDAGGGEDGGCAGRGAVGNKQVEVAGEGGEARLDGVEEDGVLEFGRGGSGSVGGGEYTFLKDGPRKAGAGSVYVYAK